MPLPAQAYEVTASFPIIPATGDDANDRDTSDNVNLTFEIVVEGSGADLLMPGEAVDAILEDQRLWAMLDGIRTERWIVPRLSYADERWSMSLPVGKPDAWNERSFEILAQVDARSGELIELRRTDVAVNDPPPPPPSEPITQTVDDLGIRLTVTLDRQRTVHGQRVLAVATVQNIGEGSVFWGHSSTCPFPVSVSVRPDDPDEIDLGRDDWPGELGILKDVSVDHWIGQTPISFGFFPEYWLDGEAEGRNFACTSDFVTSEFRSGESLDYEEAWDTLGYHEMPPAPGSYTVEATFGFLSRGDPPSNTDDPFEGQRMVTLTIPLTVEGADVAWLSPGQAMDQLLGDESFLEHLGQAPRSLWVRGELLFEDGFWKFAEYLTETDLDTDIVNALVARVDAITGEVVDVRFDPDARPRGE